MENLASLSFYSFFLKGHFVKRRGLVELMASDGIEPLMHLILEVVQFELQRSINTQTTQKSIYFKTV